MKKLFTLLLLFTIIKISTAQTTPPTRSWDGGGDGTLWTDNKNWVGDTLPVAGDIVDFSAKTATITGTIPITITALRLNLGAKVTFLTNFKIDGAASDQHALNVGVASTLTLGNDTNPYTFEIATNDTRNGLSVFAAFDSAVINIAKVATLNLNRSNNALNIAAPRTIVNNNGTINIASTAKNGIRSSGFINNNGSINIGAVTTDGIFILNNTFTNGATGKINIQKPADDGVEVAGGSGKFINKGLIEGVLADAANTTRHLIQVGSVDSVGVFENEGTIKANGGISTTARAIMIYEKGVMNNTGLIESQAGNPGANIYSRNEMTNGKNGVIKLINSVININKGKFTNNGYITKTGGSAGVNSSDSTATVIINNGFYRYDSTGVFHSGKTVFTDNGLRLNAGNARVRVDANKQCSADIANVDYEWFIDGKSYGKATSAGLLTFTPKSIAADSVLLTTTIPDISIRVANICPAAVITTDVADQALVESMFKIYPSLFTTEFSYEAISTEVLNQPVSIRDINGKLVEKFIPTENTTQVKMNNQSPGIYFISTLVGKKQYTTRVVKN
jgi:hypothetical protein